MNNTKQVSRLRLERISRGWPMREVAAKMGITVATLHSWELNKSVPDIIQATKLSRIYEIPIAELFAELFNTRRI